MRDEYLRSLAADLNDLETGHEFTTWSAEQIGAYVNEAVSLIYDKRPDFFMERKIIKLEGCSVLQPETCCDKIHRVLAQVTEDGKVVSFLRERGVELSLQWTGKPCKVRRDKFKLESYAIDEATDALYVFPKIPPGVDVYIEVECTTRPTDGSEVPTKFRAAVSQWVFYRARMVDAEVSAQASEAARSHYQAFFETLGIENTSVVIHKRAPA